MLSSRRQSKPSPKQRVKTAEAQIRALEDKINILASVIDNLNTMMTHLQQSHSAIEATNNIMYKSALAATAALSLLDKKGMIHNVEINAEMQRLTGERSLNDPVKASPEGTDLQPKGTGTDEDSERRG